MRHLRFDCIRDTAYRLGLSPVSLEGADPILSALSTHRSSSSCHPQAHGGLAPQHTVRVCTSWPHGDSARCDCHPSSAPDSSSATRLLPGTCSNLLSIQGSNDSVRLFNRR